MIRSNFAITRALVFPFGSLLALYLAVIGGGGLWLYHQVQALEGRRLTQEMRADMAPFTRKVRAAADAIASFREPGSSLIADAERLFGRMAALRAISIQDREGGYGIARDEAHRLSFQVLPPLPANPPRTETDGNPVQGLPGNAEAHFFIRFDLSRDPERPLQLSYAFDRARLLDQIETELASIRRAIFLFGLAGILSILIAVGITLAAMHTARTLESHFQTLYQRAALTETAAQLVHDLRNPLAALRANVKALSVTPDQWEEIVAELDRDILHLNDKLTAFLQLTRQRDEPPEPIALSELIGDAVRVAEPELRRYGLGVAVEIPPDIPRPHWQHASLRDALVNLLHNAAQSGQRAGRIHIRVRPVGDRIEIWVEDRGRGIPPSVRPHLFEPFYTTREDGTGLGLAIVQRIVANHQGWVRAEARPGGGTRIRLSLPRQPQEIPRWWHRMKKNSRTSGASTSSF